MFEVKSCWKHIIETICLHCMVASGMSQIPMIITQFQKNPKISSAKCHTGAKPQADSPIWNGAPENLPYNAIQTDPEPYNKFIIPLWVTKICNKRDFKQLNIYLKFHWIAQNGIKHFASSYMDTICRFHTVIDPRWYRTGSMTVYVATDMVGYYPGWAGAINVCVVS